MQVGFHTIRIIRLLWISMVYLKWRIETNAVKSLETQKKGKLKSSGGITAFDFDPFPCLLARMLIPSQFGSIRCEHPRPLLALSRQFCRSHAGAQPLRLSLLDPGICFHVVSISAPVTLPTETHCGPRVQKCLSAADFLEGTCQSSKKNKAADGSFQLPTLVLA